MSKLANINDNFLFYSIYLNIFTGLLAVHFLPLTLFLRIPLKMFSFFCLINIYFINMDCNPTLSQNSACQWSFVPDWEDGVDVTRQWHLWGTSKCVCGSRNNPLSVHSPSSGSLGHNTPKGLSGWRVNFMSFHTGSLVLRVSVWIMAKLNHGWNIPSVQGGLVLLA